MKILLISGLYAPADGNGLQALGARLQALGHQTVLQTWDADLIPYSDAIVAHSYGASSAMRWLEADPERKLEKLIFLDGVPRWSWGYWQWNQWKLSKQVKWQYAFYRGSWLPPWSSKIVGGMDGVTNFYRPLGHSEMPANTKIHDEVIYLLTGGAK